MNERPNLRIITIMWNPDDGEFDVNWEGVNEFEVQGMINKAFEIVSSAYSIEEE